MIKLVRERLKSLESNKPFILEGFPRTIVQAEKLDEMLVTLGVTNNMVAYLDISLDVALKRVLGRVICPQCKRSYNIYFENLKSKSDNICDYCNVELLKRNDDTEETFKKRFNSYLDNASDIIDFYKNKGIFKSFKTDGSPEEITAEIVKEARND